MNEEIKELIEFRAACVADMKEIATAGGDDEDGEAVKVRFTQLEDWVTEADERLDRAEKAQALEDAAPKIEEKGELKARTFSVVAPKSDSSTQDHPLNVLGDKFRYSHAEYAGRVRSAAMQILEDNTIAAEHAEEGERKLRGLGLGVSTDSANAVEEAAAHMVKFGNEDYVSGFAKIMSGREGSLTEAEYRAAVEIGGGASGGENVVPTHLDPTVVLTNDGSIDDIQTIANTVTLVEGNTWNGVSSAGVTTTWTGEAVEATDNSPVFAGKAIATHRSITYLQGSIEAFQDMVNLGGTFIEMLADGRRNDLNQKLVTGTGTLQPTGILTALDAVAASEVATDASGVFDADDLYDLRYVELPPRWRGASTWLMSDGIVGTVRQFGSSDANYSVNITADGLRTLMGRPLAATEYLDTAVAAGNDIAILGDFRHYKHVQRMGVAIERIQNVMGSNQRPTGERGLVMYARDGADVHIPEAFRLLQVAA